MSCLQAESVAGMAATSFNEAMETLAPSFRPAASPDLTVLMSAIAEDRSSEAFAALFNHFAPRVKAYLMRLGTGGGDAEELAQEVMLTVWRRAQQFDPGQASLSTWIFTIARNKRIDALRRERRPEFDPEDPALLHDASVPADQTVAVAQRDTFIREAVAALPKEQAELLKMSFFEDKSHGAIARDTGLPLGTVKSRLRLALTRLRGQLGNVQ